MFGQINIRGKSKMLNKNKKYIQMDLFECVESQSLKKDQELLENSTRKLESSFQLPEERKGNILAVEKLRANATKVSGSFRKHHEQIENVIRKFESSFQFPEELNGNILAMEKLRANATKVSDSFRKHHEQIENMRRKIESSFQLPDELKDNVLAMDKSLAKVFERAKKDLDFLESKKHFEHIQLT
jgi:chlorite dismutase